MSRKHAFQFLDLPREMPRRIPVELRTSGDWGSAIRSAISSVDSRSASCPK